MDSSEQAGETRSVSTGRRSIREAAWESRPWLRQPASESAEDLHNFRLQILDPDRSGTTDQRQEAMSIAVELESLQHGIGRVASHDWRSRSETLQDRVETAQTEDRISTEVYRVALTDLGAQNSMAQRRGLHHDTQDHSTDRAAALADLARALPGSSPGCNARASRIALVVRLASSLENLAPDRRDRLFAAAVNQLHETSGRDSPGHDARASRVADIARLAAVAEYLAPDQRAQIRSAAENPPSLRGLDADARSMDREHSGRDGR
jgi:hypothetical protein